MGAGWLAWALMAAALAQEPGLRTAYAEALRLHQEGNLAAALQAYDRVLGLRPGFVPALSNSAVVLVRLGRYEEAIDRYRQALDLEPENTAIRVNLALAHYKRAEFRQAAAELELAHTRQPGHRQARDLLADCYLRLGENRKVIALLEPLEATAAEDLSVAWLLGMAFIRERELARGQRLLDRILRQGETAEAQMLIGAAALEAADYSKALAALKKAAQLKPDLPGLQALYGRALMENDDPEAAKQAFRRELASDPDDFDSNLHLGALLRIERKLEEAAPFIERALRLRPASIAARYQMASIELARGRHEEACRRLEAIVAEAPEFLEAHVQLAAAYYKLNRPEDGRRQREVIRRLSEKQRQREQQLR